MDKDEASAPDSAPDLEPIPRDSEADSAPELAVESDDTKPTADVLGDGAPVERPISETIGTGSFFGIGCTIFALLFVCVGVAIFMWRQVN